jgi:hypothetical protein
MALPGRFYLDAYFSASSVDICHIPEVVVDSPPNYIYIVITVFPTQRRPPLPVFPVVRASLQNDQASSSTAAHFAPIYLHFKRFVLNKTWWSCFLGLYDYGDSIW